MKKFLLVLILFVFISKPFKGITQTINVQDSLALVDLYDSTNGSGWISDTNWLSAVPVSSWYGVAVEGGRVVRLYLSGNNLIGTIPSSLGNLTGLYDLDLHINQITGNIPSSLGNFLPNASIDLSYNQLNGTVPPSLDSLGTFTFISLNNNQFTFKGMEQFASSYNFEKYSPQADIPLTQTGSILAVSAGGTLGNNTYRWYKGDTLVATKNGDSTFAITTPGNYSVAVTNSIATELTLYSISTTNVQDSLALVDLYNSMNGAGWINNTNWLTTAPASTWYGVTVRSGRVTKLQLFQNNLTGVIPSTLGNLFYLTYLDLYKNQLTGNIPASIGDLSNLSTLNFSANQLSGNIPSTLGNLFSLSSLNLSSNQLTGNIPSSLGNLSNLGGLYLYENQLSGNIPSSLGNLSNLSSIDLHNNQLSGIIPDSLSSLSNLFFFRADHNQLSGSIPGALGKLSNLSILGLSNNQLSGNIPDSICFLSNLNRLQLQNNQLTGKIPDSLGNLLMLFDLQLDNNHLSGDIPSLIKLEPNTLHLQNNEFTFSGMENLPVVFSSLEYAPQAIIPLNKKRNILSVSAGGTLANDTFRLYKDGILSATQTGDSTFSVSSIGNYYITVTNAIATKLTLYTDTTSVKLLLADSTTTVTQNVSGNSPIDINDGIFKLVTITPTQGANQLSGSVTTMVTIDTAVSEYHNLPYVQRHYDITPSANAAQAQATVTLYFTQQDFDNFNAYVAANNLSLPALPTAGIDNGNVRITQFHGMFTGTSNPANYADSNPASIIPIVIWDSAAKWWTVTFPVSGFSGFYVSTANFTLPLTLLQFTGKLQDNVVRLQWLTNNEVNTKQFIIERSNDGILFRSIGQVAAKNIAGKNLYKFTDGLPLRGSNFYRLKMIDQDGNFTYSNIVAIDKNNSATSLSVYPNPSNNRTTISFNSIVRSKYILTVSDVTGKVIKSNSFLSSMGINTFTIDVSNYASGTYFITLVDQLNRKQSLKLSKQ